LGVLPRRSGDRERRGSLVSVCLSERIAVGGLRQRGGLREL